MKACVKLILIILTIPHMILSEGNFNAFVYLENYIGQPVQVTTQVLCANYTAQADVAASANTNQTTIQTPTIPGNWACNSTAIGKNGIFTTPSSCIGLQTGEITNCNSNPSQTFSINPTQLGQPGTLIFQANLPSVGKGSWLINPPMPNDIKFNVMVTDPSGSQICSLMYEMVAPSPGAWGLGYYQIHSLNVQGGYQCVVMPFPMDYRNTAPQMIISEGQSTNVSFDSEANMSAIIRVTKNPSAQQLNAPQGSTQTNYYAQYQQAVNNFLNNPTASPLDNHTWQAFWQFLQTPFFMNAFMRQTGLSSTVITNNFIRCVTGSMNLYTGCLGNLGIGALAAGSIWRVWNDINAGSYSGQVTGAFNTAYQSVSAQ